MKILSWISRHEKAVLWSAIGVYIAVFSGICLWKYGLFAYDGLDLAIYNNVFWNTAHGRLFGMTIHPHSYLGDHGEFGLLALMPFYALFQDPRTLLVLQTVALALSAWPVFWLAKNVRRFSAEMRPTLFALALALAWLLNPIVHNINLYEFHFLPFALVPLLFMLLAYENGQRRRFVLFAALAMLVREDVALVVAAVGALALLEKKSWWWRIVPVALGSVWFVIATRVIAHFSPNGGYKFLVYYSWLLEKSWTLPAHLLTWGNLEMLLGFGLPLFFIPFFAPRRLILAVGPLLQIVLGAPGGSSLVLQTHYAALFLPALFLATISAIQETQMNKNEGERGIPSLPLPRSPVPNSAMAIGLLLFASIYGVLSLGPLPFAAKKILSGEGRADARDAAAIVSAVPKDAAVVASYRLLAPLSSRDNIFSAHYVFLGVEQFDAGTYALPEDLPVQLAFDDRDLLTYRAQMLKTAWSKPHYEGGRERLARIAGPVSSRLGHFTLYEPASASFMPSAHPPIRPSATPSANGAVSPPAFADGTAVNAHSFETKNGRLHVRLDLTLGSGENPAKTLTFKLPASGQKIEFPLINDFRQSAAAGDGFAFETDFALGSPTSRLTVELKSLERTEVLDELGSMKGVVEKSESFGTITLP